MLRLAVAALAAAAAALGAWVAPASAQPIQLFPGATYDSTVQFTPHGPVSLHVVVGPRPVGLYRLRPVLSNDSVVLRETVSSMERRLSSEATSVGVNGDYFSPSDGRPSGIVLHDGILATPPNASRSSAGITLDGLLDVRKVGFRGTWRGTGQQRALTSLNKAPASNGVSLFTSDWGSTTPRIPGAVAVVLGSFPSATPNTDIAVPVTAASAGSSVRIRPDTAVLVARGTAAATLETEAAIGTVVTLRLVLQPDWSVVSDAIGGGPTLVRDGAPVYSANEAFTTSQLAPRGPRTAVGQRADGRDRVPDDRRPPARILGRDDELRARPGAREVRSRARDGARRRWLVDARLRRHGAEFAVGRQGARRLERTPARVLRRLPPAAARGGRVAERRRRRGRAAARVQGRAAVDRERDPDRADRTS